jgi:HlyD family secretion protein
VKSFSISAPRLSGTPTWQLTITKLAPSGMKVKKGDLLVEFDRQDQIKNFMDRKADYTSLVDQIQKKKADQAIALAQDQTGLKQAEDALETAKLEMRKNEVIDRIDAEKNTENEQQAEATLKQLRQTFDLKRKAATAELKDLEIQRDRNRVAMEFADHNAEKLSIHSPLDGLVVLNNIWKGNGMAEAQEGDQVRPGTPFMQVVNPNAMEVRARINQADVGYLKAGQPAQVRLDAYPDLVFAGAVEQIAAIGEASEQSDKVHYFPVIFSVRGTDPRLMPDLSAAVDVELERRPNALIVPRDTVMTEKNQAYVRVKSGVSYEMRPVETGPTNDVDEVIESGVDVGAVVLRGANP